MTTLHPAPPHAALRIPPTSAGPGSPLDRLWQALQTAPADPARHLGEALVERNLITPAQLAHALELQSRSTPHRALGAWLGELGLVPPETINAVMAEWLGLHSVDVGALIPDADALHAVPMELAERGSVLPLMVRDGALVVAVQDPWDAKPLLDELRFLTGLRILPVAAAAGSLAPAIARAYHRTAGATAAAQPSLQDLAAELARNEDAAVLDNPAVAEESDSALVQFVNKLIANAIRLRASDIHVETAAPPDAIKVRLRIDGELTDFVELPARFSQAVVFRLKLMADLDIAEHRKPQDGKIDFARFGGPHVELRMVTVPTTRGLEDVVLRLLSGLRPMPLDGIDLSAAHLATMREVIEKPYGLILICGPTGSGKTTTLHSVMRELNTGRRKIWTAEDPVEITQKGLRQVQVNPRIGWTFAAAMRTFLRADPDVIMIGEMRDEETARIAIEASLTGHLVMSTLHTNSAAESITRLLEIGLDPFLFSDSLLAILAQRLVRRLCTECRTRHELRDADLAHLARIHLDSSGRDARDVDEIVAGWRAAHGDAEGRLWLHRRQGCTKCDGSGYHGRLGVHELLVADDRLRELIRHRAPARDVVALAQTGGMVTLRQDGIDKVLAGLTDLPEVMAATNR